jgi:hypothetical protein
VLADPDFIPDLPVLSPESGERVPEAAPSVVLGLWEFREEVGTIVGDLEQAGAQTKRRWDEYHYGFNSKQ